MVMYMMKSATKNCQKLRQLIVLISAALLTSFGPIAWAGESDALKSIRENYVERPDLGPLPHREPASYAPDDDIEVVPFSTDLWIENLIVPDDAGVMDDMSRDIAIWQQRERFVEQWDIEPIDIYSTPDDNFQQRYVGRHLLRYLDKRISGEIKKSEEGSAMHSVGQVRAALKPQTEARISKLISLKFKAKVLRGRVYMFVKNPYVDSHAMVSASGRANFQVQKTFEEIGFTTRMQYQISENSWVADFDQEITGPLHARASSTQRINEIAFGNQSDQSFGLYFNYNF